MPATALILLLPWLAQTAADGGPDRAAADPVAVTATALPASDRLAGREADAWAATIALRLAEAGRARCPVTMPASGLVLQHLSQFQVADRAGVVAALPLDRGPGVIAVVADGPGARAGVRAGDVLVGIDGAPFPPETGLADPFDPVRAQARADAVDDRLARDGPYTITILRDGLTLPLQVTPRPTCPSRVRVARSGQRNAFADGRHVFLTTGLLARLRSDDELAFVIAHEMAHNILGHAAVMRGDTVRHGLGKTLGRSGAIVRGTEREADRLAGELMLDAGFDPVAGAVMLRRLGGTDLGIALFAAHDPVGERIAAMRALVAGRAAGREPAR